ncbi:MAG: AraC family transcriptional regulator [Clostridia bacterium]|nr:AraC family transcriptional regulator [Clostridia bacterium]
MKEDIYIFSQYVRKDRPANVLMAGVSYCDSSYSISRSDYDAYVIEYTLEGHGILETDGKRYEINAGDIYFLYKGKPHRYYCRENSWTKIWIVLQGEIVQSLFGSYLKQQPAVLHGCDIYEPMQHIIEIAKNNELSYDTKADRIIIIAHQILIDLQRNISPPTQEHSISEAVKQYIDNRLYQPLVLDAIAGELHYSKNHIINVFRNAYGYTPYAYYEKLRMQFAADLLNGSSQSISDISAKLGFDSPQYFSKRFKRHYGITPGNFRKKARLPVINSIATKKGLFLQPLF